jgi:hypothetical protein
MEGMDGWVVYVKGSFWLGLMKGNGS